MASRANIVVIFLCALLTSLTAQGKAKQVPDESIKTIEFTYSTLNDLNANFIQTTKVALLDRTIKKEGTFRFKKGGKLRIEYQGADPKHYVSDGKTIWVYTPGDESTLQKYSVSDETVPKEALSFMNGFVNLEEEFKISPSKAFSEACAGCTALNLVPRSKARHYEYLDALFGTDHIIKELIIKNTSGNVSHYFFSNIRLNTGLSDTLFSH